jgi:hypothetical protein
LLHAPEGEQPDHVHAAPAHRYAFVTDCFAVTHIRFVDAVLACVALSLSIRTGYGTDSATPGTVTEALADKGSRNLFIGGSYPTYSILITLMVVTLRTLLIILLILLILRITVIQLTLFLIPCLLNPREPYRPACALHGGAAVGPDE